MSEHTLGPWRVSECDWRVVVGADGYVIADIRSALSDCGREDAALIAAAPTLLALVRRYLYEAEASGGWEGDDDLFAEASDVVNKLEYK